MFHPGIHLPVEIAGVRQYGRCADGIFLSTKQGVICIELLANTIYTGRTSWYGTELTFLIQIPAKLDQDMINSITIFFFWYNNFFLFVNIY